MLVLRNPARRGFVGSVNRGMALSDRDVVLLNSDTEVTAGWLGKLQEAACSRSRHRHRHAVLEQRHHRLPPPLRRGQRPARRLERGPFRRLVERARARERPRLPTGVGVCLYIKRKALDRLGPFDEESFGLGYGEESEFCFRALKAGYLNVLDDATFIYHAGQRSFGASRSARVQVGPPRHGSGSTPSTCRRWRASCARTRCGRRASGCSPSCGAAARRRRRPPAARGGCSTWCTAGRPGTRPAPRSTPAGSPCARPAWREVAVYARIADPGPASSGRRWRS